jgi:hypothetical protein
VDSRLSAVGDDVNKRNQRVKRRCKMKKNLLFISIIFPVFIFLAGGQLGIIGRSESQMAFGLEPGGAFTDGQVPPAGQEFFYDGDYQLAEPSIEAPSLSLAGQANKNLNLGDGNGQSTIVIGQDNVWTAAELQAVEQIVEHTVDALAGIGLDDQQLLDGYRFGRYQGEYVDGVPGRLAIVDHQQQIITLSDAAFKRHHGFNIYHELGHVVDRRLGRQLSQLFHDAAGSQQSDTWTTADGYWLRQHGREDREEATADAFALWVMTGQANFSKPVFYGTPVTVDYNGLNQAIEEALLALGA